MMVLYNENVWSLFSDVGTANIYQQDGLLVVTNDTDNGDLWFPAQQHIVLREPMFIEANLMLDENVSSGAIRISLGGGITARIRLFIGLLVESRYVGKLYVHFRPQKRASRRLCNPIFTRGLIRCLAYISYGDFHGYNGI